MTFCNRWSISLLGGMRSVESVASQENETWMDEIIRLNRS